MEKLISGHAVKAKLMHVLKEKIGIESCTVKIEKPDCVTIDRFCMLHLLNKPDSMKSGSDLINSVCSYVDQITANCSTVIVAFDTYHENSLNQ